jgi:predicted site-specific integrase-resolvase
MSEQAKSVKTEAAGSAEWVRMKAVRERFGVSKETVRKWVEAGLLHPVCHPGQVRKRYVVAELNALAKSTNDQRFDGQASNR